MAKKITVVVSQGQSANPAKRKLEEDLVATLLFEPGVEVTVIPNLYDLDPDGTGMLCLQGIAGDMIVVSWLFPRAAHWILARNDVRGRQGETLLVSEDEEEEELEEDGEAATDDDATPADLPRRTIYCLDMKCQPTAEPFVEEIRRIVQESRVQTVDLLGWVGGTPQADQMQRYLNPAEGNVAHQNGNGSSHQADTPTESSSSNGSSSSDAAVSVQRIEEETRRRWYPVIDYARCTNCLECLDFCLFGVYGIDRAEAILVEQPDNCRKGCPACSRVCPENAIIFPQHKTPAIAGSLTGDAGAFKIDLSKLFGAPDALEQAVLERDVELVADGRTAVGMTVGIPKRQSDRDDSEKDDLDDLLDQLDDFDL